MPSDRSRSGGIFRIQPTPRRQPFPVAAGLIAFTPGANQLLSLRNAVRQGTIDALVAVVGRLSAFLLLVLVAAAGLGELPVTSEPAFAIVKWCGVAYLLYLGGYLLYQSRATRASDTPVVRSRTRRHVAERGGCWIAERASPCSPSRVGSPSRTSDLDTFWS
ncbi:LysE family transporter [Nocardia sp. NPDC019395]|uniref:LysE family translocator n=1 Tax=Nocardia sp. NPDC019395 TaxID=3154686 RepID=UPI0033E7CC13